MSKPILKANAKTIKTLNNNISECDLSLLCDIIETDSATITLNAKTYQSPARLGTVIDDIIKAAYSSDALINRLTFGKAELNTRIFLFTRLDKKTVPLTEKEAEILTFLHQRKPEIISKNTLLKSVWDYAENVETHTLETHIYRLRQKIERDPSTPEILLTKENGYTVL